MGLCSYVIKTNIKFFPKKFKGAATRDCHWKEMHHSQLQKGTILADVVSLLCSSPPCPVLATARQREQPWSLHTDSNCQELSSGLALGRGREVIVTDTAGSCWRKVVDFLWSTEWCADQCDFLFCQLWACWAEQESWLLSSSCREENFIAGESWEQQELEEGWKWKQTPAFCQLGT